METDINTKRSFINANLALRTQSKEQLGRGEWPFEDVKTVNRTSQKNTWLVQGIVNNPRAGGWVNGGEVRGRRMPAREEHGIQTKHLDFMQCFANCVSGNGFLGNTARQVEWPRLWRRPLLQTEELCFYQVYKLGFLARFYLKKEFHDLNKSENCSHAIKLSDAFKTRNSRVSFLAEIWVLKDISSQWSYEKEGRSSVDNVEAPAGGVREKSGTKLW